MSRHLAPALFALAASCGSTLSHFELRPPRRVDDDARPIARAPARRDPQPGTTDVVMLFLRPISHAFLFDRVHEARDVNALDEVPDSTWFTDRTLDARQAAVGPCAGHADVARPLSVLSVQTQGSTPGVIALDATGRRYVIKVDPYPRALPETNTAADAIVTRLYWDVGFNSPCNTVAYLSARDFTIAPRAYELDALGQRLPLRTAQLDAVLARGGHAADGTTRVSLSLVVEGLPLGPWPAEGVRDDDPNDTIPHEARRELRGERLLAAWVNHWDSREQNSFDSFIATPGGGYVRHWFIDFSDALGAHSNDAEMARRLGYQTYFDAATSLADLGSMGLLRHPWDDAHLDPRSPTLGYFGAANFDPMNWTPVTPQPRFTDAQDADLGWMARRIARVTPAHLRAIVAAGRYSDHATETRVLETLVERRATALRASFARTSPLADVAIAADGATLCATDLGLALALDAPERTGYAVEVREGPGLRARPALSRGEHAGELCVSLPRVAVDAGVRADDPSRYVVLDVVRSHGHGSTRLRAHLIDQGPARGYALVGLER